MDEPALPSSALRLFAVPELEGCNYGVKIKGHKEIFVSPTVFSLFQSDPELMSKALSYKEGTFDDYPFLKRFKFKKPVYSSW